MVVNLSENSVTIYITITSNDKRSGFGGLEVACWPLVPKLAGSNPTEDVGVFKAKKSSVHLPRRGSKGLSHIADLRHVK
jgi:hypothetical protein